MLGMDFPRSHMWIVLDYTSSLTGALLETIDMGLWKNADTAGGAQ